MKQSALLKLSQRVIARLLAITVLLLSPPIDTTHAGDVIYQYDDSGRLKKVMYPDTKVKDYTLDPAGNRTNVSAIVPTGGVIAFTVQSYTVSEGVGTLQLSVGRSGTISTAAGVTYTTVSGTAVPGSDFTAATGTLSWTGTDVTPKTITLTILNDTVQELTEQLLVRLSAPTGGAVLSLAASADATVVISDNDAPQPGTLQFTASTASVAEGAANITVTVSRINGSSGAASINCATANGSALETSDYGPTTALLTWANGDSANKSCTVPILDGNTYEGNETFTLYLYGASGATMGSPANATVTIAENDPAPSFAINDVSVDESGISLIFTVTKTGSTSFTHAVTFATANGTASAVNDYSAVSGTLSFLPGDITKTITVALTDDSIYEDNESFTANLSVPTAGATIADTQGVGTIINNDARTPPGYLQLSGTTGYVAETAGSMSLTVQRTGAGITSVPISVVCSTTDASALAGQDYVGVSTTISWAEGDTSDKTCTVPILDDSIYEPSESFSVRLTSPTNGAQLTDVAANLPWVMSIVDNEVPPPAAPPAPTWPASSAFCETYGNCWIYDFFTFGWNSVGGSVTRYELEEETTTGIRTINVGMATSYTMNIATLPLGGIWYEAIGYRVRACNDAGCGAYSSQIIIGTYTTIDPGPG